MHTFLGGFDMTTTTRSLATTTTLAALSLLVGTVRSASAEPGQSTQLPASATSVTVSTAPTASPWTAQPPLR
jgi:hypothetical protein